MDGSDPASYQQRRDSFTRSLHHFHETRGTPFKRLPEFCGKEVDLFRLYNLVTEKGGWLKVNRTNGWDDLIGHFNLPKNCANGGSALKHIYIRYLDRYEKVHFLGENGDRNDDEEDVESRHRRWSARAMHTVALTYNHHQHNVGENARRFQGMSTDLYKSSEYERLALSLVSPLPNEQDFAINVCTLLSNEGKHSLRLDKCPRLMEYLLAHAGVYNHGNLRVLFEEIYGRVRGHSLNAFWNDILEFPECRDLTDEAKFLSKRKNKRGKPERRSQTPENSSSQLLLPESIIDTPLSRPKDDPPQVFSVDSLKGTTEETQTQGTKTCEPSEDGHTTTKLPDEQPKETEPSTSLIVPPSIPPVEQPKDPPPDPVKGPPKDQPEEETTAKPVEELEESERVLPVVCNEESPVEVPEGAPAECCPEVLKDVENSDASVQPACTDAVGERTGEAVVVEGDISAAVVEEVKPVETPEQIEERIRLEREAAEAERKATEERLARELVEADHYEALLRAEAAKKRANSNLRNIPNCEEVTSARKRGGSVLSEGCSDDEVTVIGVRPKRLHITIEKDDYDLFNLGRESGTRDVVGQRVMQVANILRNLSFSEESVPLMAQNTTFLRFLLLCANSRWSSLHQMGLDMLGNIAPELKLEDPLLDRIVQVLFGTVSRGVRHSDRFVVLSSLEVLNKVCQRDENEDAVTRTLDQVVYEQVCQLLSLHDIMILLYTLECLYSISSMGEKACNFICRSRGAIQMLLSLVTVEAQSYGPKACILMRVIETVSGGVGSTSAVPHPPQATPPPSVQTVTTQKIITPQLMRAPSPKAVVGMPMGAVATPVQVPNPCPSVITPTPQQVHTIVQQPTLSSMPSVQQQHAQQQTVQENEQFALAWVRANYELSVGGRVEQHEMYNKYVDSCAKMDRKGVITAMHFPRIVRSVFGGTVGPKPIASIRPVGQAQPYYDGIQVRDTPLTINVKLVPVTEVPSSTPARRRGGVSPILKAQLVSPGRVTPPPPSPNPTLPVAAQVCSGSCASASHPSGTTVVAAAPVSPVAESQSDVDNSSLIKSLLASKVTQRQAKQAKLLQAQQHQSTPTMHQPSPIPQHPTIQQTTASSLAAKVIRLNGVIQETPVDSNHLPPTGVKGKKEPPQPPPKIYKVDAEDSDSRASSSRDFPTAAGCTLSSTDNESSLTSFEGIFLNGIDLEAAYVEGAKVAAKAETEAAPKTKSLMLADLLDKKEVPPLNGVIGERGLELVEKAILTDKPLLDKSSPVNNGVEIVQVCRTSVIAEEGKRPVDGAVSESEERRSPGKRPADSNLRDGEPVEKKPKPSNVVDNNKEENGEDSSRLCEKEVNGEEEVRASSKAANLFAALAAEALEDETDLEMPEVEQQQQTLQVPVNQNPQMRPVYIRDQQPLIVTAAAGNVSGGTRQIIMAPSQSGQVLISAGGQLTLQKPPSTGPGSSSAASQSVPMVLQNQRLVQTGLGQQYFVQSSNSSQPMLITQGGQGTMLQGQTQTVLLTQTNPQQGGSSTTKTIIILQQQPSTPGGPPQQQKLVLSSQGGNVVVGRSLSESPPALVSSSREVPEVSITQNGSQLHVVRTGQSGTTISMAAASAGSATNGSCQQIQVISSGVQNNAPILAEKCSSPGLDHSVFLCEWRSCMRSFKAASEVYLHVCSCHCPVDPEQETQCLWGRCDGMKRKRFSLMTHLYDRHCNADVLNVMAMRRKQLSTQGRTEIPVPPAAPPHPGYGPNAAFHAIKRHAGDFANPKELMPKPQAKSPVVPAASPAAPPTSAVLLAKAAAAPIQVKGPVSEEEKMEILMDDNEGPVTKSIRLTASLILRNLVNYSSIGRRFLKGYEPHLANIALSNVESSRTIAQVLADLNDTSSAR